ncbi:hypothetical protein [Usitatibacter palustris]|uniref:Zinc-ribbon 15 domain-containing protein n=1 Tax=Usitatibacter palustris TaxID=2732487 RepID=A0A6M4H8Z6_9PROT|nr:hypothetical protein [Usitatibacter palustris]QJR16066.1 hypothetical protein DSM104440_02894 [Usitatibacter palustris]
MIYNIGWMKETLHIRTLFKSYCYHCSNSTTWHLWREKEWFMFFGQKSFPFMAKNLAVCKGCEFVQHVPWLRYLKVDEAETRLSITTEIQQLQLSTKNDIQKRFLLAQRAEHDAKNVPVN